MRLETGKVTKAERSDNSALFDRDPKFIATDKAAVAAIVQACVNVELFTIPLYMVSMYSIQGVHQVTGSNNMYQGKLWPGMAPSFEKNDLGNSPNSVRAFNTLFSVFIEEMLHLQLAANLANVIGVKPDFTQLSPEEENYAWNCYGTQDKPSTIIPYILDFKDCKTELPEANNLLKYSQIKVKLDALTEEQNELFLAIEENDKLAWERIRDDRKDKYRFHTPFKDWTAGDPLPMFGTIGRMYQCLYDYFNITYKYPDGTTKTLWEIMYSPGTLQRDIFNASSKGHPYKEYQGIETTILGWLPQRALDEIVLKLISAITDQGEGSSIEKPERPILQAVKPINQASKAALEADYPSYSDSGEPVPSTHAHARSEVGAMDHYERFEAIKEDLKAGRIITWDKWRKDQKP
ncbi:MAG TPA: ferritin-like domain-containing protein, partial [Ferruginibacter sp.]|nr:ferritin-like domain-containing protein [Ferruginibacter sp.]